MTTTTKKAAAPTATPIKSLSQEQDYQPHTEKSRKERIATRRARMPKRYRVLYDRCTSGKASPRQAIRMQCLECYGWVQTETAQCDNVCCPLFRYRPYQKRAQVSERATLEPKQARTKAGG